FKKYKLILTTKSLTVGIDCQLAKFTHGIHYAEHQQFTKSFELVQAIHRMRKISDQTIFHVGIAKVKSDEIIKHKTRPAFEIKQYFKS
ncbi:hypothetical protein U2060_14875, partial [Listeria monocytogenes]|uniref:hypothetical protein n=1 Tax=Listeria monocytogenes TaxID=1639 RepID=UPI002FDBEC56